MVHHEYMVEIDETNVLQTNEVSIFPSMWEKWSNSVRYKKNSVFLWLVFCKKSFMTVLKNNPSPTLTGACMIGQLNFYVEFNFLEIHLKVQFSFCMHNIFNNLELVVSIIDTWSMAESMTMYHCYTCYSYIAFIVLYYFHKYVRIWNVCMKML